MTDLFSLLTPLANLRAASERERALVGPMELAVLGGHPVTLPRVSGRKSARLLAAEQTALLRAEELARHLQEREAARQVTEVPVEFPLPCWMELPPPGEVFVTKDGRQLECIDVLFENAGTEDDNYVPHLLLVLPYKDPDSGENDDAGQTSD